MARVSRREFLASASLAVGALVTANSQARGAATPIRCGTDLVTLGRTGIKTSVLGMGTGSHGVRRSSNQLKLGLARFTRLIRHGIDRGLRYIDTADQYGTHIFVREALKGVDREGLYIQTKTRALHPEVAKVDIERFRQELGVDCIDSLLMHAMDKQTWPTDMRPVMDVLAQAKEQGRVRAVGVSSHKTAAVRASIDCDWLDVQLAPINPFGAVMDTPPKEVVKCLAGLHGRGKGVIGMKLFACGRHVTPKERFESLKFVLGLSCVDTFPIGFETPEQIDDTLDMIKEILQ